MGGKAPIVEALAVVLELLFDRAARMIRLERFCPAIDLLAENEAPVIAFF